MSQILTNAIHHKAKWRKPDAYHTSVAHPLRYPRPVILRSSCGHIIGIGYVFKKQGYVAWKQCR